MMRRIENQRLATSSGRGDLLEHSAFLDNPPPVRSLLTLRLVGGLGDLSSVRTGVLLTCHNKAFTRKPDGARNR